MNERIEELAEESYNEFYNVHIDWKMFAELIIKECARQVTSNEALNIMEHFGVDK